jgi:hypothetical protein
MGPGFSQLDGSLNSFLPLVMARGWWAMRAVHSKQTSKIRMAYCLPGAPTLAVTHQSSGSVFQKWGVFQSRQVRSKFAGSVRPLSRHTDQTGQFLTEMLKPSLRRCNPMPVGPWRIMPDVLLVSAFQIGHPFKAFI